MALWLALDRSGTLRWTYHINLNDIPSALMRDAEDNLYFSTTKKVFSLTASGRKRWEREWLYAWSIPASGAVSRAHS